MLEPFSVEITREDFLSTGWEAIIETCDRKECSSYFSYFFAEETKLKEAGNERRASIFRLLGDICSLHLKLDAPEQPYGPLCVMQGRRSAILDDFDDTHLQFLDSILTDITDAELRARVADVLCIRKRHYRYAEIAVAAYLEVADMSADSELCRDLSDLLERAIQIATPYGRNTNSYKNVVVRIEKLILNCTGEDALYMPLRLMRILIDRHEGDNKTNIARAEQLAKQAEADNDWERSRQYWEVTARWYARNKEKDQERTAKIAAAECYVKNAEWCVKQENFSCMNVTHWLEKAVTAMRRIGGMQERVQELHVRLLSEQP